MTTSTPNAFLAEPIEASLLAAARVQARAAGMSMSAVLEQQLGLPPAQFMQRLGHTLQLAVVGMEVFISDLPSVESERSFLGAWWLKGKCGQGAAGLLDFMSRSFSDKIAARRASRLP